MKRLALATLVASLLALVGCVHVEDHDHHGAKHGGPPPHAPAHGYRQQHGGADLRYDGHLGVYVVIGHPDHFFHDGFYYRRLGSRWDRCGSWKKGNWKPVELALVPPPLVKHYKAKGSKPGKGKGQGRGPAKQHH
jgi:hypothetical protein